MLRHLPTVARRVARRGASSVGGQGPIADRRNSVGDADARRGFGARSCLASGGGRDRTGTWRARRHVEGDPYGRGCLAAPPRPATARRTRRRAAGHDVHTAAASRPPGLLHQRSAARPACPGAGAALRSGDLARRDPPASRRARSRAGRAGLGAAHRCRGADRRPDRGRDRVRRERALRAGRGRSDRTARRARPPG